MENLKTDDEKLIKHRNLEHKYAATQQWIESQNEDTDYFTWSEEDGRSSIVDSDCDTDTDENTIDIKVLGTQIEQDKLLEITGVKELMNTFNSVTVGNVKIENSTGVHIGNVTNINGDINIIHTGRSYSSSLSKKEKNRDFSKRQRKIVDDVGDEEYEERCCSDAFIARTKFKIPRQLCAILPRSTWLAQRPMDDYIYLKEPVLYVVISHTATESSEKRALNVGLVRDIQCFHIETRGWNDIAYNFLIGCDGNIYEGRGWGVVGAHTLGYNKSSIGISFIGCFMRDLPTQVALTACKNLLKRGVEEGHLSTDYRLITHAQCSSTESPGRKLIEEIKTWDHYYRIEDED